MAIHKRFVSLLIFLGATIGLTSHGWAIAMDLPVTGNFGDLGNVNNGIDLQQTGIIEDENGCPRFIGLATCSSEEFWASRCGELERTGGSNRCADILNDSQQALNFGETDVDLVDNSEQVVLGDNAPYPAGEMTYEGFEASYAGQYLDVLATSRFFVYGQTPRRLQQQQEWVTNCSIQSCEEYVFDKYYDYVQFEQYIAPIGDDDRAVFEAAYGADGVARSAIRGVDGRPLPAIRHGRRRPARNRYREFRLSNVTVDWFAVAEAGSLGIAPVPNAAVVLTGCTFSINANQFVCDGSQSAAANVTVAGLNSNLHAYDETLLTRLAAGRQQFPNPASQQWWDFHEDMSQQLSGVSDARLVWLAQEQKTFLRQFEIRDFAATQVATLTSRILAEPTEPGWVVAQRNMVEALKRQDELLQTMLDFAEVQGCLDAAGGLSDCDWSPQWLADTLRGQYLSAREDDYQACMGYTANRFGRLNNGWLVRQSENPRLGNFCVGADGAAIRGCTIQESYIGNTADVETYYSTVDAWRAALPFPKDPDTGAPMLGSSASDDGTKDDGGFGIGIDYAFDWDVELDDRHICDANIAATAHAGIDATAFGRTATLLGVGASKSVARTAQEGHVSLTVLGIDIHIPPLPLQGTITPVDGSETYTFSFHEVTLEEDSLSKRATFWVGWVPFTFEGGLAGQVGVRTELDANAAFCAEDTGSDFTADVAFAVEPFAGVDAFASGLLGVPGVGLGIRTDITIVDASLPFSSNFDLDVSAREVSVVSGLDMAVELLKGRVDLVAELLIKTYKRRLFGWGGIAWDVPLMKFDFQFDLDALGVDSGSSTDTSASDSFPDMGGSCLYPAVVPSPDLYASFDQALVNTTLQTVAADVGSVGFGYTGIPSAEGIDDEAFAMTEATHVTSSAPLGGGASTDYTHAFWYRAATADIPSIFFEGFPGIFSYQDLALVNDALVLDVRCSGGPRTLNTRLTLDREYHHIAIVHSHDSENTRVWVDGQAGVALAGCHTNAGNSVRFSGTGWVDDFLYYNDVALSQAQLQELHSRGMAARPSWGPDSNVLLGVVELVATGNFLQTDLTLSRPPSFDTAGDVIAVAVRASDSGPIRNATDGVEVLRDVFSGSHTGLTPGTTYHYRAFAETQDGGVIAGPHAVVTAIAAPQPPVRNPRTAPDSRQIRLRWNNPTNLDFYHVSVRRSTTAFPGNIEEGVPVQVALGRNVVVDRGLEPETTYYYTIFARSAHGSLSTGVHQSSTTLIAQEFDLVPPGAVTQAAVVSVGGALQVSWQNPSDSDLSRIEIIRFAGSSAPALVYSGLAEEFTDSGVVEAVEYRYHIVTTDISGNTGAGVNVRGTVGTASVTAFWGVSSQEGIQLNWQRPASLCPSVRVRRSSFRTIFSTRSGRLIYVGDLETYLDTSAVVDTTYHYGVFCENAAGQLGPAVRTNAVRGQDLTAPSTVSYFSGYPGIESAMLTWTNPVDSDLTSVHLRYSPTPMANALEGTEIYQGLNETFTHSLSARGHYLAYTEDGSGNRSAPQFVTVEPLSLAPAFSAVAGPSMQVYAGDVVTLDATQSIPPLTHGFTGMSWRQIGQVEDARVELQDSLQGLAYFVAPAAAGTLEFELTVTDGVEFDRDRITVTVLPFVSPEINTGMNPFVQVIRDGSPAANLLSAGGHGYLTYWGPHPSTTWRRHTAVIDLATGNETGVLANFDATIVSGDYVMAGYCSGIALADVSTPAIVSDPATIRRYDPNACVSNFTAANGIAALGLGRSGQRPQEIQLVDVGAAPVSVLKSIGLGTETVIYSLEMDPATMFLYASTATLDPGIPQWTYALLVYDLNDTANPVLTSVPLPGAVDALRLHNGTLWGVYVDTATNSLALKRWDISVPDAPSELATVTTDEIPGAQTAGGGALSASGDRLYQAGNIYDISQAATPVAFQLTPPGEFMMGPMLRFDGAEYEIWYGAADTLSSKQPTPGTANGFAIFPEVVIRDWTPAVAAPLSITQSAFKHGLIHSSATHIYVLANDGVHKFDGASLPAIVEVDVLPRRYAGTSQWSFQIQGERGYLIEFDGITVFDLSTDTHQVVAELNGLPDVLRLHTVVQAPGMLLIGFTSSADAAVRSLIWRFDISDPDQIVQLNSFAGAPASGLYILPTHDWLLVGPEATAKVLSLSDGTEVGPWSFYNHVFSDVAYGDYLYVPSGRSRIPLGTAQLTAGSASNVLVESFDPVVGVSKESIFSPRDGRWWGKRLRGIASYELDSAHLRTTPRGYRPVSATFTEFTNFGDHIVGLGRDGGVTAIPKRLLNVVENYDETPGAAVLDYQVSWQSLTFDLPEEVQCTVSRGTCSIASYDGAARTAMVQWTTASTSADDEIMIYVGHAVAYESFRDQVKVTP